MTPDLKNCRRALNRTGRSAITLTEMLVAILILGVMLSIAIPLYLSSEASTQEIGCQANMSAIYQAEQAYRARSQTRSYTTNMADLTSSMVTLPTCPDGTAEYTLSIVGTGSSMVLTISCPNNGAHVAGKTMSTTDGLTFTFQ